MLKYLKIHLLIISSALLFSACSDDTTNPNPKNDGQVDQTIDIRSNDQNIDDISRDDAVDQSTDPCPRLPAAADRDRVVIVSRPFKNEGEGAEKRSPLFEVMILDQQGVLKETGQTFELESTMFSEFVFTPDGEIGLIALASGKIGVFRIGSDYKVSVVHQAFSLSVFASRIIMSEDGQSAYVLSTNWRNNGGGIYQVEIACDGSLTEKGQIAEAKLPFDLAFVDSQKVVIAANDILDSVQDNNVHLVDLSAPSVLASANGFQNASPFVSSVVLTNDKNYVLVADNSMSTNNSISVLAIDQVQNKITPIIQFDSVTDPANMIVSPYDNLVLITGTEENSIWAIDYDVTSSSTPFSFRGKIETSTSTLLPYSISVITRGSLKGHVLVGENTSIRQLQLSADGSVKEIAENNYGTEFTSIVGAVGIQP